ncbi:class I SAM-dependent methyltransferase [Gordonia sp. (in: high G+C Gram-positive bacteria)]|uniref:class I SAM-dependent methyltransferase n=1 Tax=Gordonia sp. (in: high G+C Gram-positive bacteria) TaxID=84139 RepID=UPI0016AF2A09|nr:class I SAM-dependent methyltransferase [Gordonia sp. (in: high G+C Gram-positive bacteria)]NLG44970.1 methyltransferase domain-containing protein [Gordonia sp. (in: high G+C Gram-positive bacteria)]
MSQHEHPHDDLPMAGRKDADMPGHWLLARMGKRVLRPGGLEMTSQLLADAGLTGADVVELAPGLGKTAGDIVKANPKSYTGVEADPEAVALTQSVVGARGTVVEADAAKTGLTADAADVVVGEAMLTMQSTRGKDAIVGEAFRVLRPGGRYAIHELALNPDTLSDDQKAEISKALARSIKVNARPLTEHEWREVLEKAGFEVERVRFGKMALLEPRRNLADEGLLGTLKIVANVARNGDARQRILGMRKVFRTYRNELAAIEVIARKPAA